MKKWRAKYVCANDDCKHELTYAEVYQSNGVCPYCGNLSENFIVEHHKLATQEIPEAEKKLRADLDAEIERAKREPTFGTQHLGPTMRMTPVYSWWVKLWRWLTGPPPWASRTHDNLVVTEVDRESKTITVDTEDD